MKACQTARPVRKHRRKTLKIPLSNGGFATVDRADEDVVAGLRWCVGGGKRYAMSWRGGKSVYLHRLILPALPGFEVDHIDGNPLNNTRANLRVCTRGQNLAHSRGWGNRRSRFKNVRKVGGKWRATGWRARRPFHFGCYDSEIVAACIADDAAVQLWGEFAWLNFPKVIPRNFLRRFIGQSRGRVMSVTFYKRRNSKLRTMLCRVRVTKGVTGKGLAFEPKDKGLISVYDMQNKRWRFVPVEGVLCLTYKGRRYRVTPYPQQYPGAA